MGSIPLQLRSLLRRSGTLRTSQLVAAGVARVQLSRMVAAGTLKRVSRGIYALPSYRPPQNAALLMVAQRAPRAVICLLTALRIHDITTQSPAEIWIAIGNKDRPPRMTYPKLRVMRFSARALVEGVHVQKVDGVAVNVTGVARTVADCFKFRNKIGSDVALEALQDCWRGKRATINELWAAAKVCRVTNVMRPYLETLA